jgi:hypothetical protein
VQRILNQKIAVLSIGRNSELYGGGRRGISNCSYLLRHHRRGNALLFKELLHSSNLCSRLDSARISFFVNECIAIIVGTLLPGQRSVPELNKL